VSTKLCVTLGGAVISLGESLEF